MRQELGAVALLAVCAAAFWLVRRYAPPATCPHCGSRSWILLDGVKQCRDCGSLFQ